MMMMMKVITMIVGARMLVFRMWKEGTRLPDSVRITANTADTDMEELIKITEEDCKEGDMVHRMFARRMIQDLQDGYNEDDFDDEDKETADIIEKFITYLALKYNLASKYTSFIGVSKAQNNTTNESNDNELISIHVPNQVLDNQFGPPPQPPPPPPPPPQQDHSVVALIPPLPPAPGAVKQHMEYSRMISPINDNLMLMRMIEKARIRCVDEEVDWIDNEDDSSDDWSDFDSEDTKRDWSNMEKILHLSSTQTAEGVFSEDKITIQMIGQDTVSGFLEQCKIKSISAKAGFTALVVAFIEENFEIEKNTWEPFVKKSYVWVNNPDLISEAKDYLSRKS